MNRTLPPQSSSLVVPASRNANWFDRQQFAIPAEALNSTAAYSCFAPQNYESGYAYPLIVWLHGEQSNEDELPQVMPLVSTRNFVAIAPRGPRRVQDVRGAYTWDDSADCIAEAADRVDACVAIARERFHIHLDRIFVAGHGAGGTMAHRLGLEFPDRFAGAISLGGHAPRGSRLFKNLHRAKKLPLLLCASPTDGIYSTEEVTSDLRFLHNAGLSLSLRLYPAGDSLTTVMFEDLNKWVMEQFCSSSTATAS
ncbi:MAG: PHB depolymerase family esterase [Planctomycetota bacterium]